MKVNILTVVILFCMALVCHAEESQCRDQGRQDKSSSSIRAELDRKKDQLEKLKKLQKDLEERIKKVSELNKQIQEKSSKIVDAERSYNTICREIDEIEDNIRRLSLQDELSFLKTVEQEAYTKYKKTIFFEEPEKSQWESAKRSREACEEQIRKNAPLIARNEAKRAQLSAGRRRLLDEIEKLKQSKNNLIEELEKIKN